MLQIVNLDINNLKVEMKKEVEYTKGEIRELKRRAKQFKKSNPNAIDDILSIDKKINKLNEKLKFYRPTRILPVEVNKIVINYKIYQKYVESLKDLRFEEKLDIDKLIVKHEKGCLELYDISKFFRDFSTIPKAVLK